MELILRSRNGKVSDRHRKYIETKLTRLERYMDIIERATVEITEEQRHNEGAVHRAQVTLQGEHGVLLRAERHANDLHAAVDEVADTLQRQIQRYKEKHWRRGRVRRQGDGYIQVLPARARARGMIRVGGGGSRTRGKRRNRHAGSCALKSFRSSRCIVMRRSNRWNCSATISLCSVMRVATK